MDSKHFPPFVNAKLLSLADDVGEHVAERDRQRERVAQCRRLLNADDVPAVANEQERAAYRTLLGDARTELRQLIGTPDASGIGKGGTLAQAERRADTALGAQRSCREWLAALPDDAALEHVTVSVPRDATLDTVRDKLRATERELSVLRQAPVPSPDIEQRIRQLVGRLGGGVRVHGVDAGHPLQVDWPSPMQLLAALLPDQLTALAMRSVEELARQPIPVPQRPQRIHELATEIERLQRVEEALVARGDGERLHGTPAHVILGCRQALRIARRRAAAAA